LDDSFYKYCNFSHDTDWIDLFYRLLNKKDLPLEKTAGLLNVLLKMQQIEI